MSGIPIACPLWPILVSVVAADGRRGQNGHGFPAKRKTCPAVAGHSFAGFDALQ
jgi:hypothetical protein